MAMKMTRLRNEIMADFDTYEGEKRVFDRSLGREDLEHWMKGKNYLSMTKFQFIDRFILRMARQGRHDFLFHDLISLKELAHRKTFSEIYSKNNRENDDSVRDSFKQFEDKLMLSEIMKAPIASKAPEYSRMAWISDFRQVAILVRNLGIRSASVTVAYLDTPLSDINPDFSKHDFKICFGYLTVIGFDEFLPMLEAVMHVVRGEFPGDWHAGNTISAVNLHLDGKTNTNWIPQIYSQSVTTDIDNSNDYHPILQIPSGFCTFNSTDKFSDFREHLKNLTNMYAIW